MSYELHFHQLALKEWKKLDQGIKDQFKKALVRRLNSPHIASTKLKGQLENCYKIKLRKLGYRLVYHVDDDKFVVLVIAVGKRDKNIIYKNSTNRNY